MDRTLEKCLEKHLVTDFYFYSTFSNKIREISDKFLPKTLVVTQKDTKSM